MSVRWQEPRLVFIGNESSKMERAILSTDMRNYLWMPDLYIYHLKSISAPLVFKPFSGRPNELSIVMQSLTILDHFYCIYFAGLFVQNKTVLDYSLESHLHFWCKMKFTSYPFDRHVSIGDVGKL